MYLLVLLSISNVHSSKLAAGFFVEELVAGPVETADDNCVAAVAALDIPAPTGHISLNALQKVFLEWGLRLF